MLCYVMLCYVMLCYVMLCYVMLCYVMLCYVMLCHVMSCLSYGIKDTLKSNFWQLKVKICNDVVLWMSLHNITKWATTCDLTM